MPAQGISDTPVSPLALALAAAAGSLLDLEEHASEFRDAFVPVIGLLDHADGEYRRTIEEILSPEAAGAMLSGIAAFREKVREIRERARREIGGLYERYRRSYGWFDPLDTLTPPTEGFSHADSTRVATMGDSARSNVDALRAQVNAALAKRLVAEQTDALVAAKRRRREAFAAALRKALEALVASRPSVASSEIDKTVHHLMLLADGWY